jgi:hypothetical protein
VITSGSKFWFGVAAFAAVASVAYVLGSDGEAAGTIVLIGLSVAATFVGIATVANHDGTVRVPAEGEPEPDDAPVATSTHAMWPILGALGAGVVMVGLVTSVALVALGLVILGVVLVEWMVQGWADNATGDPAYNRRLRNQMMYPFEIPLLALLVIAAVVFGISRVLLALPQTGSTIIAMVVATVVLGAASLIAARPQFSQSLVTIALVVGGVLLIGGAIAGSVAGEREFHYYGDDHGEEHDDADEDALQLLGP